MTNASIYLYDTLEDYMLIYPKGQDIITENHLSSLWINEKNVVLVSDNRNEAAGYKPDFSKSLVYFDQGEKAFKKYEDRFEPIVGVEINPKSNSVVFSGQKIEHSFAIARKIQKGFKNNKKFNVSGYILYDDAATRLNLIINPVKH
jgi:hypothetical protein